MTFYGCSSLTSLRIFTRIMPRENSLVIKKDKFEGTPHRLSVIHQQ